ncbi:MAG: hypothetical protein K0S65_367 [Labilithrix sp.]|nr:hypothetical protein [Labilithrix sp.]
MRGTLLLAGALAAIAALVACATSDEGAEPPREDAGPSVITEAGSEPRDASVPEVVPIPPCSDAGWCPTALPDVDLVFKDIWPLQGRAFAIAESATLGVKILEWEDAEAKWKYIDDNSQNQAGLGDYAGRIWAPNADEVFFSVAFGTVGHGKRPVPPATTWTWELHRLDDRSPDVEAHPDHDHGYPINKAIEYRYPALGVWGIGGDIYAWYANTVYRWTSTGGGAPAWTVDYTAADVDAPDEHIFFVSAAGPSAGEVWFVGAREREVSGASWSCPLVVRKTPAGYERLFDGDTGAGCTARMGVPAMDGPIGWLMDLQVLPGNRFVGIKGGRAITMISGPEEGTYSVEHAPIRLGLYDRPLFSAYFLAENQLWLSGMGIVVRGDATIWDGGAFGVSTISLNGGPIDRPIYQVRGTSDTNLWAVGVRHALHKTTH